MANWFRGTTPTLTFNLPIEVPQIAAALLTIKEGNVEIRKELTAMEKGENNLSVKLTQEETLKLMAYDSVQIQLRIRTLDGTAMATEIYSRSIKEILSDGVI